MTVICMKDKNVIDQINIKTLDKFEMIQNTKNIQVKFSVIFFWNVLEIHRATIHLHSACWNLLTFDQMM